MRLQPHDERTALALLDMNLFSVANQLGSAPGLAAIKFNDYPESFGLPGKRISLVCMHHLIYSCVQEADQRPEV